MSKQVSKELMNKKDFHGNTVLSLSAKLSKFDNEYLKLVHFLLKQGANPKIKDS